MNPLRRIISIALTALLLLTALVLNPVVGRADDPSATSVPVDAPTEVPTDTPAPTSTDTPQPPTDTPTDVPATDTAIVAPTDTPAPTDTVGPTDTVVSATDTATTAPQPTRTAKPKATATATAMATTNPLQSLSLGAEADTSLGYSSTTADTNYGSDTSISVDRSPEQAGLIRFTITGGTGALVSAKLRLYVRDATDIGPLIYLASNEWNENTVTGSTQPIRSEQALSFPGPVPSGSTVDFDVTRLVGGNGTFTFELVAQSADRLQFSSRDSGASTQRPKLIVEFEPRLPRATPTETSTPTLPPTATFTAVPTEPVTATPTPMSTVAPTDTATVTAPTGTETATPSGPTNPGQTPDENLIGNSTPETFTFSAEADTYVSSTSPDANYGSQTSFAVDQNPLQDGLIRFNVTGGAGTIVSATLRLYVRDSTNIGPLVYLADNNWDESTVTWANRPSRGAAFTGPAPSFTVGSFAEFDVTGLVNASGQVTFNLVAQSQDVVQFTSKDSGASSQRPQLVVMFVPGGPTATSSLTVTATTPPTETTTPGPTNTPTPTPTAGSVTISLKADADAYIDATAADSNFGTLSSLRADAKPEQESLLRFKVTGVTGTVTKAVLTLYVSNGTGTNTGPNIFLADNSWSETTVTWNNRPTRFGSGLQFPESLGNSVRHDFDVTDLVGGNGTFTFDLLATTTNEAIFSSKESGGSSLRPVLTISVDPAGPTATASATMTSTATPGPTATSTPSAIIGNRDFAYPGAASAPSAKEGQSKVWFANGSWWGAIYQNNAFRICRLQTSPSTWVDCGQIIDSRATAKIDALWDAGSGKLYTVASVASSGGAIVVTGFSPGWSQDFTTTIATTGSEDGVVTIAKDSTGTLWVTYAPFAGDPEMYVTHSNGSNSSWVAPYVIPVANGTTGEEEDLPVIVAFSAQVGIMWSNQIDGAMYFARHVDGTDDRAWVQEVANGPGVGVDNHISLKSDSSGRVYAALKTSGNSSQSALPLEYLAVRGTDGVWRKSTVSTVADNQTRGVVVVDEANGLLYFFSADYSTASGGGGSVYYKTAALGNWPVFGGGIGKGTPIISSNLDVNINNASSTKQIISGGMGILIIASDDHTHWYLHNLLP